jgi:hypothetical protein
MPLATEPYNEPDQSVHFTTPYFMNLHIDAIYIKISELTAFLPTFHRHFTPGPLLYLSSFLLSIISFCLNTWWTETLMTSRIDTTFFH